jgi:hypothetical protein
VSLPIVNPRTISPGVKRSLPMQRDIFTKLQIR